MKKILLCIGAVLITFIVIFFYPRRNFFQSMRNGKTYISKQYFFKIKETRSMLFPFHKAYKYQTNIYGSKQSGYLCDFDSIICEIDFSGSKLVFIDLRKDKSKQINYKSIIPNFNRIRQTDWYEIKFLNPPHSIDLLEGFQLRITYKTGIDSIIPIYRKKEKVLW